MTEQKKCRILELYCRDVSQFKLLTKEAEITLAKRIQRGSKSARAALINANLRLVVKIAHDYSGCGMPVLDLISEGNIGLSRAAERFDPKFGCRFSTYAGWWIRQGVRRALSNQSRTIRMPVHASEAVAHLLKAQNKLECELGRQPTRAELAAEVGLSLKKVNAFMDASQSPLPLDMPATDGGTIAELIPDGSKQSAEICADYENHEAVIKALKTLPERHRVILEMRFGFDGGKDQTLETLGHQFGITRERVRQIQVEAMGMLKKKLKNVL